MPRLRRRAERAVGCAAVVPPALRALVVLVTGEAVALVGLAVFTAVEVLVAASQSVLAALSIAGITLLLGLGLGLVARLMARRRRAARSPGIVVQLLLLPVGWDLAHSALGLLGVLVLGYAVLTLVLLVLPSVGAALSE